MTLHKLWGLMLENCNIREFWTAGVSFKWLKCILHYTLYVKQIMIIFNYLFMITPLSYAF